MSSPSKVGPLALCGYFDELEGWIALEWVPGGSEHIQIFLRGDTHDDEVVDISDPIYGLYWLFLGGPAPPHPFPRCGRDPTAGAGELLDCPGYPLERCPLASPRR